MKKYLLLFWMLCCICYNATAQNITTIAGTGSGGYSGDGGIATSANLSYPVAIVFDTLGNMYVADQANYVIRKVTSGGVISTFAGTGSNSFNGLTGLATSISISPNGLGIDRQGNILVGDELSYVRKITPSGILTTIAGTGTNGFSGDGGAATAAQLYEPNGVIVNKKGEVVICDYHNFCIRKIDTGGIITTIAGTPGVQSDGGDGGPATAAYFSGNARMAYDKYWNLYTGDQFNNIVRKIDTNGIITTIAGTPNVPGYSGDGGAAISCTLTQPSDLSFDKFGNLYIADGGAPSVIRMIDTFSVIHTIAGTGSVGFSGDGGSAVSASLYYPYGLSVYYGNVFIADTWNNRIRKVTYFPNSVPYFTGGDTQSLAVCVNAISVSLNTLLQINDADTGQTETIFVTRMPAHGSIIGGGALTSTGGILTPTGFTYTPTSGYVGNDTMTIYVKDGAGGFANTTINITVNPLPFVSAIMGLSLVCTGNNITLTDTTTGGLWTASNINAIITDSGIAYGFMVGIDTINYTVSNLLCSATATKIITVSPIVSAGTITGISSVCTGATITLSDTEAGGTWNSSNSNATAATGGVITGVTAGMDTIQYSFSTVCGIVSASTIISVNTIPSAGTISGDTTVCAGAAIALTEGIAGGIWTASNTNAFTTSVGLIYGLVTGIDTISYSVSNMCGIGVAVKSISINPLPDAGVIFGSSEVCPGSVITVTDAITGGTWSSGNILDSISSGIVTGISAGTDTIKYTVTNSCGTAIAWSVITINPLPNAGTIADTSNVCVGSSIVLIDTITGGTWSAANSNVYFSGTEAGMLLGVTAGTDTVSYTVTNSCGFIAATKIITINPLPNAGIITGSSTVCAGSSVSLADSASGGTWSKSNSSANISTGGIVSGNHIGRDTILYTVTNSCGTVKTRKIITIDSLPVAGVISGTDSVCAGTFIALTDTTASAGVSLWNSTNMNAVVSSIGTVTGLLEGIDTIMYSVTNACGISDATKAVTIVQQPVAGAISGRTFACIGKTDTLSGYPTDGIWSLSNSNASISFTGVITGNSVGLDTVIYSVSNYCGTAKTSTYLRIYTAFQCDSILSVSTVAPTIINELKVYPNPNTGIFIINLVSDNEEEADVVVTNILGKKIKELTTHTNKEETIMLDRMSGIYFVIATTKTGMKYCIKFVVE